MSTIVVYDIEVYLTTIFLLVSLDRLDAFTLESRNQAQKKKLFAGSTSSFIFVISCQLAIAACSLPLPTSVLLFFLFSLFKTKHRLYFFWPSNTTYTSTVQEIDLCHNRKNSGINIWIEFKFFWNYPICFYSIALAIETTCTKNCCLWKWILEDHW